MAIERVSTLLKMADEANTSAIGFNCIDYNTVYAACHAAEMTNTPTIIMLYPEHCIKNHVSNLSSFVGMFNGIAEQYKVPLALHLDHSSDINYILEAIKAGFTSVMYDGTKVSVEENIANSKKVVEIAKVFGVDVEAELGYVGFASNADEGNTDSYTTAETAAQFSRETGVTSLAIAIGSAHGFYSKPPKLDIDRLIEINNATDTYLVLHGGSGIPNDQLDLAFRNGINKFNVGTEYFALYYDTIRKYCEEFGAAGNPFDMPDYIHEVLVSYLVEKMKLSKFNRA